MTEAQAHDSGLKAQGLKAYGGSGLKTVTAIGRATLSLPESGVLRHTPDLMSTAAVS
jgi:hypothetical protein